MITSKDRKEAEDFCNASEYLSLSESAKQEAFIKLRQLQNRVSEAVKNVEAAQEALRANPNVIRVVDPHFEGPVLLSTEFFFPRPKGHFRSNGELKGNAPTYVTTKPDFDNCAKAVADALTQLGFWKDDSQIAAYVMVKRYTQAGYSTTGAIICIRELGVEQVAVEQLLRL